ncbi:MAG: AAA family ATPase [Spongiibacteraceae bacterium]
MYYRYFGLKEAPFSIAVNPRYLFMSARHQDALAHLLFGVGAGGGFILLTGEVGTGKTTINRCLLQRLPETTDIALILNPALNAIELLATACDELGIAYNPGEQSLKVLTDKLHQFLLANHARGRNTVLLIDEAQHLQFSVLEQIRLLTNLETNTKKLLQIILVGQPELRSLLNKPELRQLAQRITARYQLKPLNLEETKAYIRHRLHVAGLPANQQLFPNTVVNGLFKASRGVPRLINVLCDRMLLGIYGQNKTVVDRSMLKQAINEVMGDNDDIKLIEPKKIIPWGLAFLVVMFTILTWWQWPAIDQKINAKKLLADNPAARQNNTPINSQLTLTNSDNSLAKPTASQLIDNEQQAIKELLKTINLDGKVSESLCYEVINSTPRCERLTAKTWQALFEYDRPVVLSLITPEKMQAYITLVEVRDNNAIISNNGVKSILPLASLAKLWTGDFIFIWQPSEFYITPFSQEHSGPIVKWLADKFSELDHQAEPLSSEVFNDDLLTRVKIFQRNHHLKDDGVVGLKTLLKLNQELGLEKTLISKVTENSYNISEEG